MFRKRSFRIIFSIIGGSMLGEALRILTGKDFNLIPLIILINLIILGVLYIINLYKANKLYKSKTEYDDVIDDDYI